MLGEFLVPPPSSNGRIEVLPRTRTHAEIMLIDIKINVSQPTTMPELGKILIY